MTCRYYLILRPPFIGTHPKDEVRRFAFNRTQYHSGIARRVHGWVEYDEPLSAEQVEHYDLVRCDPDERIATLADEADKLWWSLHDAISQTAVGSDEAERLRRVLDKATQRLSRRFEPYAHHGIVLPDYSQS